MRRNEPKQQLASAAGAERYSEGLVCIDGQIGDVSSARVSVFDRGFLYGDSIFETLRTYAGVPFELDEHLARLERSAERVLMRLPRGAVELRDDVLRVVELGGFRESFIRLMVTRGQASKLGLDPALAVQPLTVLIVLPLQEIAADKYERGISVITYRTQRIADGTSAAGAKLGNYLVSVLAIDAARVADSEEALLVDREDRVLEGTTSNVFGVHAGRLITPPESLGILAGITRARLLTLARQQNVPVEERVVSRDELIGMDEVFISSSLREVMPVIRVDGRSIGAGSPGPVSLGLLRAFRDSVRRDSSG
jgi:branched-chain amino acid aminotransferase